jgi:hypothetical protein
MSGDYAETVSTINGNLARRVQEAVEALTRAQ